MFFFLPEGFVMKVAHEFYKLAVLNIVAEDFTGFYDKRFML